MYREINLSLYIYLYADMDAIQPRLSSTMKMQHSVYLAESENRK